MILFLAAGIASVALSATMLIAWMSARSDRFLLAWSLGICILGAGATAFMLSSTFTASWVAAAGYAIDIIGFTVVLGAAGVFCQDPRPWRPALIIGGICLVVMLVPFLLGLEGLGTMVMNLCSALLLGLTAQKYWRIRAEAPASLIGISALYALTAFSFVLCGAVLLRTSPLTLDRPPDNWAESLNAAMCLIGITGIGALSLALNQARSARRHRQEAETDSLTGLMNRRALFDLFGQGGLEPRTAVIVFDLDHFKTVNDRFGHAVGDEVLCRFAQAIRMTARPWDAAARLGGEEFALVMPRATPELALLCAEHIRALFGSERVDTQQGPVGATVSAGIAFSPDGAGTFDSALIRADKALYAAKNAGRNRVVLPQVKLVA